MEKSAILSKTVWLNIISFVLVLVSLPEFISVLPVVAIQYIALIAAVLNLALRIFFNNPPITSVLPTTLKD